MPFKMEELITPEWFTTYLFNAFLKANEHTDSEEIAALSKCRSLL